jgi:hypothetical protein
MFNSLNINNGVLMVSAFVENNNMYLYDPGFRLQGEAPDIYIDKINFFDQKKYLIEFALSNEYIYGNINSIDSLYKFNCLCETIWILLKEGEIGYIEGIDNLVNDPNIISINQRFKKGDIISTQMIGTEAQVFARFYLISLNKKEIDDLKTKVLNSIIVLDIYGVNMILK